MQSSVGVRERIDHVYPSLRPAEQAVARYVRSHLDEAAGLTVGQLAEISRVSQPTVIRFARKLGFGGYRELRYVLRHPQEERSVTFDPLEGFDLNPWDNPDDVPGKAMTRAKTLIDELHSAMDGKALHKATTLLAQSRMIDIYGVENSMSPALDLCTKLTYLGLQCRFNADAYLQQIGAGHLTKDDTAIAFSHSGSSADTVKALKLAKSAGAHTIAVTNNTGTPLANWGRRDAAHRSRRHGDLWQRHLLARGAQHHRRHAVHERDPQRLRPILHRARPFRPHHRRPRVPRLTAIIRISARFHKTAQHTQGSMKARVGSRDASPFHPPQTTELRASAVIELIVHSSSPNFPPDRNPAAPREPMMESRREVRP